MRKHQACLEKSSFFPVSRRYFSRYSRKNGNLIKNRGKSIFLNFSVDFCYKTC
jgi:hypothetical protein